MRHLIDPLDFTLEETTRLMDLADRIARDPAAYQDVAARKKLAIGWGRYYLYCGERSCICSKACG